MSNELKPIQTGFDRLRVCYTTVGGRGYVLCGRVSASCKQVNDAGSDVGSDVGE